jgi:hypothetical protein
MSKVHTLNPLPFVFRPSFDTAIWTVNVPNFRNTKFKTAKQYTVPFVVSFFLYSNKYNYGTWMTLFVWMVVCNFASIKYCSWVTFISCDHFHKSLE